MITEKQKEEAGLLMAMLVAAQLSEIRVELLHMAAAHDLVVQGRAVALVGEFAWLKDVLEHANAICEAVQAYKERNAPGAISEQSAKDLIAKAGGAL